MRRRRSLAALMTLAALASGCQATVTSAPITVTEYVTIVRAGVPQPLAAETPIAVAGPVVAHATVLSVPGVPYARTLRLVLASGDIAVEGATVESEADMRFMTHGPVQARGAPASPGTYLVTLPIYMPGQWRVITDIRTAAGSGRVELEMDVFE